MEHEENCKYCQPNGGISSSGILFSDNQPPKRTPSVTETLKNYGKYGDMKVKIGGNANGVSHSPMLNMLPNSSSWDKSPRSDIDNNAGIHRCKLDQLDPIQHENDNVNVSADDAVDSLKSKPEITKYGLLRHTVDEMRNLIISKENEAANIFANAECTRYEGDRVKKQVAQSIISQQRISTKNLKRRAEQTYFWKQTLEQAIIDMRNETSLLEDLRIRCDNALQAMTDAILHIVNECLRRRLSRIGIDLTYDDVEKELQKEHKLISKSKQTLENHASEIREQIGKNRAAKERLEKDWSDKLSAFRIDDLSSHLKPDNPTILNYAGVGRYQERMTELNDWESFTRKNLEAAEIERCTSVKLRDTIPGKLTSTANKLREQADNVESAMARVIVEMESAKSRLMHQLKLVLEELVKMEKAIDVITTAMKSDPIESGLKLSQTRLYNRTFRPNVELTRDSPQDTLIKEVNCISQHQGSFETQLRDSQATLRKLHFIRIDLEKEIAVKDNTLVICRERCQYIRTYFPSVVTLSGN